MHEHPNHLQWLAFRYVAGELSTEEALALEARLLEEPQLREAICQAVELAQGVSQAQAAPVKKVPRTSLTRGMVERLTWAMVGAVAATLFLVLWDGGAVLNYDQAVVLRSEPYRLAGPEAPPNSVEWAEMLGLLQGQSQQEEWFPAPPEKPDPGDAKLSPSISIWLVTGLSKPVEGENP